MSALGQKRPFAPEMHPFKIKCCIDRLSWPPMADIAAQIEQLETPSASAGVGYRPLIDLSQHGVEAHDLVTIFHAQEAFVHLRQGKSRLCRHLANMIGVMRVATRVR
jgi:hypothetical protein